MVEKTKPREKPRPRAWFWWVGAAVLVAALAALQVFVLDYTPRNVMQGQWYCAVEQTDYLFTDDEFTIQDSQGNTLLSGVYKAGWRYLTLTYTLEGRQTVAKTRYTLHENGQLVMDQVNGSQVVLTRP